MALDIGGNECLHHGGWEPETGSSDLLSQVKLHFPTALQCPQIVPPSEEQVSRA